jgi:predicted O-linked N-acetylglucosamine transferase (SPINDLY family)
MDDAALAELIRADGIDILIDLAGHTAKNRLPVFVRKPAPVQASWAGYAGTTGLAAMDYLISDWQETPAGTDQWYCETIIRLPDDYVCYAPPAYAPPVGPLPALQGGGVTFGCFNNLAKLGEEVVGLWSRLLRGLPDSRLLLVTRQLAEPDTVARYRQLFARHGVARRVEFSPALPHAELLASYGRLDIALDPFPYGGGLTTLESLWMGVPVVTLAGQSFAGRHSLSHLTVAGLPELVADSEDDYLAIATGLASDLPRLAELRRGLRQRVAASPLVDGARFTANLETAYKQMWHRWCAAR